MKRARLSRLSGRSLAVCYLIGASVPLTLALTQHVAAGAAWEYAGAALGMVILVAMAVQFVTSGRIETVSGRLGIDKTMGFHQIAAWWVLLGALAHPVLYLVPTWIADPALARIRLEFYLTDPAYRSGVAALAALVALVVGAACRPRLPVPYELWRAGHVLLAAAAVGGGLHHALSVGRFSVQGPVAIFWWGLAAGVVAVMAALYGWRWWRLHRHPWRLHALTRRAERMWELDIRRAPGAPKLRYRAGQFVWMSDRGRRFPLFDHPFSIAGSPLQPGLRLLIKEAGDYTGRISRLPPGCAIGIDGPHGDFTLEAHAPAAVLLIGGGVGIAPVLSILRDMAARRDLRPVRLAYAVGTPVNFACLDEIRAIADTAGMDVRLWLLAEEGPLAPGIIGGRLTKERLRAMLDGLDPAHTTAMICGPGPMVVAVSDALEDLGMPRRNVVYERFDYASGTRSRQDRARTLAFLAVGAALGALAAGFALIPR